ncbi:complement resistance protein TraT [Campylobacter geochelonis]|uniref:Enterobacterial TraT complement resistance protein n=1 Tax=Campylobacter geochelonis TaxID=1780362 RepID=A0A128E9W1_9BACT|nr:complement resistance protein TraT [Campylobacter geochelonis]QKF72058.1 hypothetical protein CGEO_1792 [Campylobacter geochelonis]CZE45816.1 Enterobacterial TraT complement resistance protein [Campylobacter geochelonis]CZE46818.1 Enterobacterial TraT complement resistance protein [Campylobacter geochelonis]CZE49855.1 Enterobacterial TraT complement resistance protein [Campylobacter geochelonis]
MKKFILPLLALFAFVGCSIKPNLNEGIIKTSEPIFINSASKNNKTYVKFTNTSNVDSNLTSALSLELSQNGYEVVGDEKLASIIINGNLNYFRRTYIKDPDPFASFGFGFSRGRWGSGVGVGFPFGYYDDDYDSRTNSYIYDAQLSLQIRINDGKKTDSYKTNLDYQSNKNINSISTMTDIFNHKIAKQILYYLKSYQ